MAGEGPKPVAGYVLAGGRASRMGFDKALAPGLAGLPLATGVALALEAACGSAALVRGPGGGALPWRPDGRAWEVVLDAGPDRHPLWGVAAAMRHAGAGWVLFAPCDLVAVGVAELRAVTAAAGPSGAVAWAEGRVMPLVACLPASWADRAEALARAGAPARALSEEAVPVVIAAGALRDADDPASLPVLLRWERTVAALAEGGRWPGFAEGERARRAARGLLWPGELG